MKGLSARWIACVVGSVLLCLLAFGSGSARAAGTCSTANPNPANIVNPGGLPNTDTDAWINQWFTAARAAEGCNVPMVVPANYDSMTPGQQMVWLINNEREVRGLGDLAYDPSILSQIALNHSSEELQYNFNAHSDPFNGGTNIGQRDCVNPVFTGQPCGFENIFFLTPAQTVYGWMYIDLPTWGHRMNLLNPSLNTVGIGALNDPTKGWYITADFLDYTPAMGAAGYTPPATADTGAPVMGQVSYANGTATVTGVADNPANVNDTGANPLTAGITYVSFYTNNVVPSDQGATPTFNTVAATQGPNGTWSAPITVNPGDVLHAVAVDGSGNYTDVTMAAPAMTLAAGANTVALPAATTTTGTGMLRFAAARAVSRSSSKYAVTPTAAALVRSIDAQAHRSVVTYVKTYSGGRWRTYRPGTRSANFALMTGEGVVVGLSRRVKWNPHTGVMAAEAPVIKLHRGWNFVSVPYPQVGMTCHAVRLELAMLGDTLREISIGTSPNTGVILKPVHGRWGNDLLKRIPQGKGFWIDDVGSATWTPSPTGYTTPSHSITSTIR